MTAPRSGGTPGISEPAETATSGFGRIVRGLLKQRLAQFSVIVLLLLALMAILAPLSPYGESQQNLDSILEGPSWSHILGTDHLGRDTATRIAYGARVALQAAIQSVIVAALIGVPIGLWIGYRGGWWDRIIMRLVDVGDSVPGIFLAFAVIAVLGRGMTSAMLAVGLIFVSSYIRITRACVLVERRNDYVDAGVVTGLSEPRIIFRHVLPNVASPLIVQTMIFAGRAILIEAALSFLGLGLDTGSASWGGMLGAATSSGFSQPALVLAPGLAITVTVLAFNLFGDALRDAMFGGSTSVATRTRQPRREAVSRSVLEPASVESPPRPGSDVVLSVEHLTVTIVLPSGREMSVLEDVSLQIGAGETVGLVGESGSGKTMTALAIMDFLPPGGRIANGTISLEGRELTSLHGRERWSVRGRGVSMISQDPIRSLSPVHSIGTQLGQAVRNGGTHSRRSVLARSEELLSLVGIADPRGRLADYPHQLSGGMAQRVAIAMALANEPKLLIADEPTTALDVTVQEKVLDLLVQLQRDFGMSILLVTHDMGVVADVCHRAAVMYGGQVVENTSVKSLFSEPRHPYTRALLASMPQSAQKGGGVLPSIPGRVPPAWAWPTGCRFHPRCSQALEACRVEPVPLEDGIRCVRVRELDLERTDSTTPLRDPSMDRI